MRLACVPLPAPGGPSKTILIQLTPSISASLRSLQPGYWAVFLCHFSPMSSISNSSLRKLGLQRQPIGFLGVVEETKLLGDGVGGQAREVGPRQTHERFCLGAGHGDL